jgi:hypothetical protein
MAIHEAPDAILDEGDGTQTEQNGHIDHPLISELPGEPEAP